METQRSIQLEFLKERIYFPVCLQTKSILICQATVRRKITALHVNVFDFQREKDRAFMSSFESIVP